MSRASQAVKEDKDPGSVKSLLAILRQQQDGPQPQPGSSTPAPPDSATDGRSAGGSRYASWLPPAQPAQPISAPAASPSLPSNQDLQSLLKALNPEPARSRASSHSWSTPQTHPTAYTPPVPAPQPRPIQHSRTPSASHRPDAAAKPVSATPDQEPPLKRPKVAHQASAEERRDMPLSKALPILTGLLEDEQFVASLKKLKTRQDALEKDLWKRRQGIFQQYSQRMEASLHTAQILGGKTVTPSEAASQKAWLDRSLHAFFIEQCLPQFDAVQKEQAAALERLGVPGLGSINEQPAGEAAKEALTKAQAKRARIMSVLDGVLAED